MSIKRFVQAVLSIGLVLSLHLFSAAQNDPSQIWQAVSENQVRSLGNRLIVPENYRVFKLDKSQFKLAVSPAAMEFTEQSRTDVTVIDLPTPDGRFEKFRIVESPVLAPNVAAEFPDWKTYQAYGIDDPTATARLGITANGFHATVFSTRGTYQVDPYQVNDQENYITYFKRDISTERKFHCELDQEIRVDEQEPHSFFPASDFSHGAQIRTYRVAIAVTGEYTAHFGGQVNALAQVVISVNRINGVYRKDFAVGLLLVSGPSLIYPDAATDPYTNQASSGQLTVNQTNIDTVLGSANYDIGHLYATNDGGIAQLSSVCGANKARGASGQPNPQGDPFDVDYVAHEMGHQLGANHTFNSTGNCGSSPTAARMEPGSAVSIMGYAGICSSTANLQRNSIDNFIGYNQQEIIGFLTAGGSTCGTVAGTNAVPTISSPTAGANFSIPFRTPFALTAVATDANADALTYSWEWNTAGSSTSSYPGTPDDDDTNLSPNRVLMRPYAPSSSPTRNFPSLAYILNDQNEAPVTYTGTSATGSLCAATCITGEDLPSVARTVNFRVTVRDNQGGVADSNVNVAFVNTTTPFEVTSQSSPSTWAVGSTQPITWNVSATNVAPINATQVKIRLSLDGGQTFPLESPAIPNDGTENIVIPNFPTTQGRLKVEAVGNIFFDINSANITINATTANIRAPFDYDGDDRTDISIYRPSLGQWWYQGSFNGSVLAGTFGSATDRIAPADFTGDGKADWAFFRPGSGEWFVLRSEDFSFYAFPFGSSTDAHMTGDFDGDNKADATVFRSSTGTWFIQKSSGGTDIIGFGGPGDKAVVGDYDGDSKSDIAIYRPSVGQWWIRRSSDLSVFVATFGNSTDSPVPGYWTADTKTDIAFFRPTTGEWYVLRSEDFSFYSAPFGASGDIPVPGDYDGDNRWDTAVFRPSTATWFILRTTAGPHIQSFGATTDLPTPSAYVP